MTKSKLFIALLAGLIFSLPVAAKMYKWVDDKGTTHYGETIPAEYANKDRQVLDKSGVVTKKVDVLTPEERRAQEADIAKSRSDETALRAQKLHDKSLTDTYSSVKEIELSRKRNIDQVNSRIDSINVQLKTAGADLILAEKRSKAGGLPAATLQNELKLAQDRVSRLQKDLEKYKAEKLAVDARFDADTARYKELTGK
jgi:Domain of unknown function (DUF4124)